MKKLLIEWLQGLREVCDAAFGGLFDLIDKRQIVRRGIMLIVLYQAIDVYLWAKNYALLPGKNGGEVGLVIAALTVPISILQGFLFKLYGEGRNYSAANITSGDVSVTVGK